MYNVAKSSGMEALEDFEDILRREKLPRWNKNDRRLFKLRRFFETPNPPYPSTTSIPSVLGLEGKEGLETTVNYLIDLLIRCGYLLDRQMNALEEKHTREGGYNENLLIKRLDYKRKNGF